jgi:hypothetical protein
MWNIVEGILAFNEEMMMLGKPGIETGPGAVDPDPAQQPRLGELMKRVVNGRQRYRNLRVARLLVKHFGCYMPVSPSEKHRTQVQALPRWTQTSLAQLGSDIRVASDGGQELHSNYKDIIGVPADNDDLRMGLNSGERLELM